MPTYVNNNIQTLDFDENATPSDYLSATEVVAMFVAANNGPEKLGWLDRHIYGGTKDQLQQLLVVGYGIPYMDETGGQTSLLNARFAEIDYTAIYKKAGFTLTKAQLESKNRKLVLAMVEIFLDRGTVERRRNSKLLIKDRRARPGWDGSMWVAEDHRFTAESDPQSNLITAPAVDPLNPTVEEIQDAIYIVKKHFLNIKDDQGEEQYVDLSELDVLCGLNHLKKFEVALTSREITIDGGQYDNPLVTRHTTTYNLHEDAAYDWPSSFLVFNPSVAIKPILEGFEEPLKIKIKGLNTEDGQWNDRMEWKISKKGGLYAGDWRPLVEVVFETPAP